jgi:dTDP-4-dehydrorhamnose 3,5-epimerase
MSVVEVDLPGVLLIAPNVYTDERGFFLESFRTDNGMGPFLQDNHSRSQKGVLRGLHYQPGQGKLVRVSRGVVFDVAVDIRRDSPHFGQWYGTYLSDVNNWQMYIPPGFAHGFCALEEADVQYKCTEYYSPEEERGIAWDDPNIGIKWPLKDVLLSEKDKNNMRLSR